MEQYYEESELEGFLFWLPRRVYGEASRLQVSKYNVQSMSLAATLSSICLLASSCNHVGNGFDSNWRVLL